MSRLELVPLSVWGSSVWKGLWSQCHTQGVFFLSFQIIGFFLFLKGIILVYDVSLQYIRFFVYTLRSLHTNVLITVTKVCSSSDMSHKIFLITFYTKFLNNIGCNSNLSTGNFLHFHSFISLSKTSSSNEYFKYVVDSCVYLSLLMQYYIWYQRWSEKNLWNQFFY